MAAAARQGDLFNQGPNSDQVLPLRSAQLPDELSISDEQLQTWQARIHRHQAPLFQGSATPGAQTQLFGAAPANDPLAGFNPLALRALPLSFWRWPESPHQGAAIYLVMDRPPQLETPILLYVGETLAADRRWKSDHDCKAYLAAYGEALSSAGLASQPSIRFWGDVPTQTRARRRLELELIQTWLPPFNKESRERWATPFRAD